MAICEKCGNKYMTKECMKCKTTKNFLNKNTNQKTHSINQNNYFNKNEKRKPKNTALIIVAIAITIIALIMIKNEYVKYQEEKQIAKLLYGTDNYDEIEKINKKLMKQNEKSIEQLRKLYLPK